MKRTILLSVILYVFLLTGCMNTRYITQRYIKTNIETHEVGKFSTIKTYTIFKGIPYGVGMYLELTGYKYANKKALVIGADKYYLARKKYNGDKTVIAEITYIELSLDQCKDIMTNYKILLEKMKVEKPKINEEIFQDYTVSKDLFISYRIAQGHTTASYIDLWIKGDKFRISTKLITDKLNKFINY